MVILVTTVGMFTLPDTFAAIDFAGDLKGVDARPTYVPVRRSVPRSARQLAASRYYTRRVGSSWT